MKFTKKDFDSDFDPDLLGACTRALHEGILELQASGYAGKADEVRKLIKQRLEDYRREKWPVEIELSHDSNYEGYSQ